MRLLDLRQGDRITVSGDEEATDYLVVSKPRVDRHGCLRFAVRFDGQTLPAELELPVGSQVSITRGDS